MLQSVGKDDPSVLPALLPAVGAREFEVEDEIDVVKTVRNIVRRIQGQHVAQPPLPVLLAELLPIPVAVLLQGPLQSRLRR